MQASDDFYRKNINRLVDEVKKDIDEEILAEADTEVKRQTSLLSKLAWAIPYLTAKYSSSVAKAGYLKFIERFVVRNEELAKFQSMATPKEKEDFAKNMHSRATGEAMQTGTIIQNPKLKVSVPENFTVRMRNGTTDLKAVVERNVDLITSIPEQYLAQVREVVLENHQLGGTYQRLQEILIERFGVAKSRANLIARDQTNKLLTTLHKDRLLDMGQKFYKWRAQQDRRTRQNHRDIAMRQTPYGQGIYKWNERDVPWAPLSKEGEYIEPGQDYVCRCGATGIEEWEWEELQANPEDIPSFLRPYKPSDFDH